MSDRGIGTMKWLILFGSVWAFIIGPLMIVFRKPLGKFFYGVGEDSNRRLGFANRVGRFAERTEEYVIEYYKNWGIACIVAGSILLIVFFLS